MKLTRIPAALLLAAALVGTAGCKGNINNDEVIIPFTTRASLSSRSQQSNNFSFHVSISGDGRYVAFASEADNLVPGDINTDKDVFVRDLATNTTVLVSVNASGTGPGDAGSYRPAISADGRFVAFVSSASDLQSAAFPLPDLTAGTDIYVRDLSSGTTILFSVDAVGTAAAAGASDSPAIATNATHVYVSYRSDAPNIVLFSGLPEAAVDRDVFVRRVPIANFATGDPTGISAMASVNTGATDGGNGESLDSDVALTAGNCYVVFASKATDLQTPPVVTDTNLASDAFIRTMALDLSGGSTVLHSVGTGGNAANGDSGKPVISRDARFIAFESTSDDLLPAVKVDSNGTKDVFRRGDLISGPVATERVSLSTADDEPIFDCQNASISSDGRFVAFDSDSPNLVEGDSNGVPDIFVRDTLDGITERKSIRTFGGQANGPSFEPAISGGGNLVAFLSFASNLVDGDTNFELDVFRHGF